MSGPDLRAVVSRLESEGDLNSRALLLAALVSEAFRARGFEPVVVGGSAIEFYTDGAYMSGDTDLPAYDCGEVVENMVDEIAGAMNVKNPIMR